MGQGGGGVVVAHDCSSGGPGSGVGIRGEKKVPELGTRSWKGVEETRYQNLFRVPGDRPKDAS